MQQATILHMYAFYTFHGTNAALCKVPECIKAVQKQRCTLQKPLTHMWQKMLLALLYHVTPPIAYLNIGS